MAVDQSESTAPAIVAREDMPALFAALHARGYAIVGPTVRDSAIVYDELERVEDLPIGWTDEQEAGTYRLKQRADAALFGYNVGPHSWKRELLPPRLRLWRAERDQHGMRILPEAHEAPQVAFLGVRACEVRAIAIQDRVFVAGPFVDPDYRARREQCCIIAVNCGQAGNTCFCVSMQAGPKVQGDFDLSLTEILAPDRHVFLVEVGSELGGALLAAIPHRPAEPTDLATAEQISAATAASMGRSMETEGIVDLLKGNPNHPRWDDVAKRCLTCTNCTMVCPTCFCTAVEDTSDLAGEKAERSRRWDSCFTIEYSHIAGGSVRTSTKARYRQWMTHKLATWVDQFGTSGCVGCGRCITWCPVGIDITAEVHAIRESDGRGPAIAPTTPPAEEHSS